MEHGPGKRSQNLENGVYDWGGSAEEGWFTGVFTEELRRRLRHKREESRLPMSQLCSLLGVCPSTFRKWENGTVRECRAQNILAVKMFLSGELDDQFRGAPVLFSGAGSLVASEMKSHFDYLMSILSLIRQHPELEARIAAGFIRYCNACRTQVAAALLPSQSRT